MILIKYQMSSFTLPVNSVTEVNEIIECGLLAGGTEPVFAINEGFMYLRSIEDVDGYMWGVMFLNV